MSKPFEASQNIAGLHESATLALLQKVRTLRELGQRIVDLGLGEPDFPTPDYIVAAAHRAIDSGATRYTAVEGMPKLREVIASRAGELTRSGTVDAKEIVVTTGSKQALFNACFSLFGPGDDVLIPTPAWTSYFEMVALARASVVEVHGSVEHGLKATADDLERAATPRTRGVIINSPCNPTGSVYSRAELEAIVRLTLDRGWWLISDEIYRRIAYDGDATSALEVAPSRERLVVIDGMAKAYAMTGWRIGWSVAPRALTAAMTAVQSHMTSNASTPSQHATLAALSDREAGDREIARMVAQYRKRRDGALEVLRGVPGLRFVPPEGGFYIFFDVRDTTDDEGTAGSLFASRLLEEEGVAIMPSAAFRAPGWVRLSYASPEDAVVEGVQKLVMLWQRLSGERKHRAAAESAHRASGPIPERAATSVVTG